MQPIIVMWAQRAMAWRAPAGHGGQSASWNEITQRRASMRYAAHRPRFSPRGDIRIRARLVPVAPFQHGAGRAAGCSIAQARDDDGRPRRAPKLRGASKRGGRRRRRNGIDQCPVGGRALYAPIAPLIRQVGVRNVLSQDRFGSALRSSGCIAFIERSELRSAEIPLRISFRSIWVAADLKPEGAFNEFVSS